MTILYTIIIQPIEMLLTLVYGLAIHYTKNNIGLSIIVLSIIVNLLALPLYKRADEMQSAEKDKQHSMEEMVKHIKKTFKGDERFFMLQTYYRQNDYKPYYVLRGAFSLFLQVPFFIAAYDFLSKLASLRSQSFLMIPNLGAPDAMFTIGNISINVLPIVMTLINIISGIIYTKGEPIKAKLQLYGVAIVFLILLYNSPAGLLVYWIMNNVFSLCKGIVGQIVKKKTPVKEKDNSGIPSDGFNVGCFWASAIFLMLLVGCVIPSNIIRLSVAEFVDVKSVTNPLLYILYSLLMAFGAFVIWIGIYFKLAGNKIKPLFSEGIVILCVVAVVEYMFYGNNLGLISADLKYDKDMVFDLKTKILNLVVLLVVAVCVHLFYKWNRSIVRTVVVIGTTSIALIFVLNTITINKKFNEIKTYVNTVQENKQDNEKFKLSKTGKNVVFIMLDRAMGTQFPYIINERPELKEIFSGFTYYRNTVSYGNSTNFGAPAIYGGYEYTPWKFNERKDELIPDKHNEALKVLPVLFDENGYDVTVCDSPYAGYEWIPNLSIFDDYPNINAFNTEGKFDEEYDVILGRKDYRMKRNFFCYSMMRISPLALWGMLYDGGKYNEPLSMLVQVNTGISKGYGYNASFLSCYAVLENLGEMTEISDDNEDTFLMLQNSSTHVPTLLQEPDYTLALNVDNTEYDSDMESRYTVEGVTMDMENRIQVTHYHVNMASLIEVGKWLEMLKREGVYDNTRIVIVADHGNSLGQFGLITDDGEDIEAYMPLLLMKDFDAREFKESDEFMTNADGVSFMVKDIIESPINPFTGNVLDGHEKYTEPVRVTGSIDYDIDTNNGYVFTPAKWYIVSDDVYDVNNWKKIGIY